MSKAKKRPYFCYCNSNYTGASDYGLIDLNKMPFVGELSNNLFAFKWTPITQGQAVQKVVGFEKYMVEKKFKVIIGDTPYITDSVHTENYAENLEYFLQNTDVDINNVKMGRLYVGDYFLECYIVASGKPRRYLQTNKTMIECSILCEKGNWQKEDISIYRANVFNSQDEYGEIGFVYPYDYDFDYASKYGKDYLINESYMDTDFEITFYGAAVNPEITIGGNLYQMLVTLDVDDYLKINSKNMTCTLYHNDGTTENVFKHRNKDNDIYEKIKGGKNAVLLSGNANVDVKLFIERSEPKWSEKKWV